MCIQTSVAGPAVELVLNCLLTLLCSHYQGSPSILANTSQPVPSSGSSTRRAAATPATTRRGGQALPGPLESVAPSMSSRQGMQQSPNMDMQSCRQHTYTAHRTEQAEPYALHWAARVPHERTCSRCSLLLSNSCLSHLWLMQRPRNIPAIISSKQHISPVASAVGLEVQTSGPSVAV